MKKNSNRHSFKRQLFVLAIILITFLSIHSYHSSKEHSSRETENPRHIEEVHVCGITAMLGKYEKTPKEPLEPLSPSFPLFLVTDQEVLLHPNHTTAWRRVRVDSSLWQDDCVKKEFIDARNNPCTRPSFLFNIAKFYKMQFFRVPELVEEKCNVVIWMDGTVQIKSESFMGQMGKRAERGQNFVVYVHDPMRGGQVALEVQASAFDRYTGTGGESTGPHQHVDEQYKFYRELGFEEGWFLNESWFNESKGVEANRLVYGMYVTSMVMFDLRQTETKMFLDCWWEENVLRSTQDQVGFPFCAWKLHVPVHALPDAETQGSYNNNPYFQKLPHGL